MDGRREGRRRGKRRRRDRRRRDRRRRKRRGKRRRRTIASAIEGPLRVSVEGKSLFDPANFGLFELFGRWNEVGATCE